MEKKSTEILKEIEAALASLKDRVAALEQQVEAYRQAAAEEAAEPVAPQGHHPLPGPMYGLGTEPVAEQVAEPVEAVGAPVEVDFDMEIGVDDLPEASVPEPVVEPVTEPVEAVEAVEMVMEDLPEPVAAAEPVVEPVKAVEAPAAKPAPVSVPKEGTERMAWRLDKPGVSVKNIRSGISLYDRALFIGTLFKEDYALYDKTIGDLNALSTLDEAVDYLTEAFPDWNLKSDIVYNFIMAIRKKLG